MLKRQNSQSTIISKIFLVKIMSPYQNGNALFIILIAVVLFAALSYAIIKGDGGFVYQAQDDRMEIEYAKYSSILSSAVTEFTKLRLAGCSIEEIPNASAIPASTNSRCNFFSVHGGQYPYISDVDGTPTIYLSLNHMPGMGSNRPDAIIAYTLGSDANGEVNEYRAVCDYVNKKNRITYTLDHNSDLDTLVNWEEASLNNAVASPVPNAFSGKPQGCLDSSPYGGFTIYQVLEAN